MNLRSTNVRTIQDTLCIKGQCELYLRKRHKRAKAAIRLMLHMHLPVTQSFKTA